MREKLTALRKKKSAFLLSFTIFAVTGYVLFLTSKLWFPAPSDLVKATPMYEKYKINTYDMYLTRWDCATKDGVMEVIIEMENSDILDTKFSYAAVERTAGDLKVETVVEDPSYVILRITDLKTNWREVSLRVKHKDEETIKFYTNREEVRHANSLEKKTKVAYESERFTDQIAYNQSLVKKNEKAIVSCQKENKKLEAKIKSVEEMEYLTEDQIEKNKDILAKAQAKINSNEDEIEKLNQDTEKLNEKNEKIREQIKALQK